MVVIPDPPAASSEPSAKRVGEPCTPSPGKTVYARPAGAARVHCGWDGDRAAARMNGLGARTTLEEKSIKKIRRADPGGWAVWAVRRTAVGCGKLAISVARGVPRRRRVY